MNVIRFGFRPLRVWTGLLFFVTGCGGCHGHRLRIVDLVDGVTVGPSADVDPTTPGVQLDVEIDVRGFGEGDVIGVYPDSTVLDADPDATTPFTAMIGADPS